MRRRSASRLAALLALAAASLACGHTQDTERVSAVETQGHATPPQDRREAPRPPPAGATPPHDRPNTEAAGIPIASSPSGLLEPGAEKQIQDKLAAGGLLREGYSSGTLDGPTREALGRFQRQNNLPATGAPDDATVRKLGLAPDAVFKRGRVP